MRIGRTLLFLFSLILLTYGCKDNQSGNAENASIKVEETLPFNQWLYEEQLKIAVQSDSEKITVNLEFPAVKRGRQVFDYFVVNEETLAIQPTIREHLGKDVSKTEKWSEEKSQFIKSNGTGKFYYLISYHITEENGTEICNGAVRTNTFEVSP